MTAPSIVEESAGDLRLVAVVSPNVRCPVHLYRRESTTPIGSDTVNLSNAKERAHFLSTQIPEACQPEAMSALLRLAQSIDAARAQLRNKDKSAAPAAPTDEPWPDVVDGVELLEGIRQKIARYLAFPQPPPLDVIPLWVLHTYAADVTDYTPYLLVTSPVRECGKSTLLELLLWLAFAARLTGGITAAALYRLIARGSVTTLLDELDTRLRGDGGEGLRAVLNTGFHRSGKMTLCVGDDHEERDFPTYCPKVLAGIGKVWDTVASRSIPIRMERASREDLQRLGRIRGDRIGAECAALRRMALRWAHDHRDALRESDPETPEQLGARQSDVWRPLLAIADEVGGDWPRRARLAAVALHATTDDEGDLALLLLKDVYRLLGTNDTVFTDFLLRELASMEDRPWSEYGRLDKPITARGLASLLGRFGVKPGTVRAGELTGKGYTRQKLAPAFLRYIPELSTPHGNAVPAVTDVTDRGEDVIAGEGVAVLALFSDERRYLDDEREALRRGA